MRLNEAITQPGFWPKTVRRLILLLQLSLAPAALSAPNDPFEDTWQDLLSHPGLLVEKRTDAQLVLSTQWPTAQIRAHLETTLADIGWTLIETDRAKALRSDGRLNNLPFVADFIKGNARLHCFLEVLEGERALTITWSQFKRP